MFGEYGADEADDRGSVGEDADDVGAAAGVTGLLAFWMIVAAACDNAVRAGRTPLVLESIFVPGAAERNGHALQQWHRTGFPFADPGSETGANGPIMPHDERTTA
ncbi:MAG: hypothetical protein M3Q31_13650 [Actinomycetota bacterium]|nr:hypothetical protein [Actinomycetota bacterium]